MDSKSRIKFLYVYVLGYILLKSKPRYYPSSKKGYHLIWTGLNISFNRSIFYRKLLLDDKKRIKYDLSDHRKHKQVLFTRKKVYSMEKFKKRRK